MEHPFNESLHKLQTLYSMVTKDVRKMYKNTWRKQFFAWISKNLIYANTACSLFYSLQGTIENKVSILPHNTHIFTIKSRDEENFNFM